MTAIRYALREKNYHPRHDRLAKLRALYWILVRRWETEICNCCGRPVGVVWWCFDQKLWDHVNGGEGGTLCIRCFDRMARPIIQWLEWMPVNARHLSTFSESVAPRG